MLVQRIRLPARRAIFHHHFVFVFSKIFFTDFISLVRGGRKRQLSLRNIDGAMSTSEKKSPDLSFSEPSSTFHDATTELDAGENASWNFRTFASWRQHLLQWPSAKDVHHPRDIDLIGTTGDAGFARQAQPMVEPKAPCLSARSGSFL